MSYTASLIAYAFVKKGMQENRPISQMKLQKMVYFAHGYHLARFGEPLISEEFEAWQFGPVIPAIYREYKSYGASPIHRVNPDLDQQLNHLDENAKEAIDYAWMVTKKMSAGTLSSWTHLANSPWHEAYQTGALSVQIDNSAIERYFRKLFETANNVSKSEQPT